MRNIFGITVTILAGVALLVPWSSSAGFASSVCGDEDGSVVNFRQIGKGSYGGVEDRRFVVVTTEEKWKELWGEINGNVLPLPPVPEVDFPRQAVAAVFQGLKRSGGYSISVEAIIETHDCVTITVREKEPGPRNLVTMTLSSPWEAVSFPMPNKPVLFTSVQ